MKWCSWSPQLYSNQSFYYDTEVLFRNVRVTFNLKAEVQFIKLIMIYDYCIHLTQQCSLNSCNPRKAIVNTVY